MYRSYLTRAGERFHPMAPGSIYESMVQALVAQNAAALFPEFECRRIEPTFQTAAGDVRPDLVLVQRDARAWGLVEVEAEEHSATAHVKPQLAKMGYAQARGSARAMIEGAFDYLTAGELATALAGKPVVYLVTHGKTPVNDEDLRTLAVRSIEISIFHGGPNDYILSVEDGSERLVAIEGGAHRLTSQMLKGIGIWHLRAHSLPGDPDRIAVDFDGTRAVWGCTRTSDGYLLRMPTQLTDGSAATEARAYLDPDEIVLVLHTSEEINT